MSKHPLAEVFGFPINQIVNVASIPQRSPFRYPGGKTWLIPHIRQWLSPSTRQQFRYTPIQPELLIEPFAGGYCQLDCSSRKACRSGSHGRIR